ncbi:helix-turn-helix domain-containing protein [Nosocomiicoccus massiliensis]|uniref:Helix-turn-helix transcriptional regulator n=1 Tax=Nosocomiicoccus massiliensis TaxID=1232430 RepID=A0AAF0YN10_9STAP|nr:helix-turn-helix transcriptional regulator [Nosocomiicoccus massiliensis]WOS96779.1 helix-turn-helix transcriptional regulator [Nosocomiicoccus massiliensis]
MKNQLRVILAIKKISVSEIYENTGVSKTTIYGLYHEKTKNPSLITVLNICDYLGITVDNFIHGLEEVS